MNFFLVLGALLFLDVLGRTLVNNAHEQNNKRFLYIAVGVYALLVYALFKSYSYDRFCTISALWDAGTLIISILIGKFLLKEKTTTIENIGFLLIVIGFMIISSSSYKNKKKDIDITCLENVTTEALTTKKK